MCNTCGQTRCCCDSPTRYNGPDIPDVGIETGTPYDAVIQLLGEFVSDIEFEDGVGISGIAWASNSGGQPQGTQGTTDTYTITLTDNSTYDFVVTNGADGIDGVGISNIAWTSNSGGQPQGTQGTTDTYTITLTDASTYNFVVTNGADGNNGVYGGWSSEWVYDAGSTAPSPGASIFRFDNLTLGSVTNLYINDTNADLANLGPFLNAWTNNSLIRISKSDDANIFWMGTINNVTDNGTNVSVSVTTVATNGSFTDTDRFVVSYSQVGADGVDGVDGLQGLASTISRSTQIVNTTNESTLVGALSGSLAVSANTFVIGDSFMLKARGNINVGSTPADLTIRIKVSGSTVASIVVPVKTATAKNWDMEVLFTIRTIGATGQLAIGGEFSYGEDSADKHDTFDIVTVIGSLDTTANNTLDVSAQWSIADPSNSIDSELFILTKLK